MATLIFHQLFYNIWWIQIRLFFQNSFLRYLLIDHFSFVLPTIKYRDLLAFSSLALPMSFSISNAKYKSCGMDVLSFCNRSVKWSLHSSGLNQLRGRCCCWLDGRNRKHLSQKMVRRIFWLCKTRNFSWKTEFFPCLNSIKGIIR